MKIQISEVKIDFIKPQEGIIAFASIVINDAICLSSIAIHKKLNADGYRVTYPSKGKFSIFHPINRASNSKQAKRLSKFHFSSEPEFKRRP